MVIYLSHVDFQFLILGYKWVSRMLLVGFHISRVIFCDDPELHDVVKYNLVHLLTYRFEKLVLYSSISTKILIHILGGNI